MPRAHRNLLAVLGAIVALGAGTAAASPGDAPLSLTWVKPAPAPAGWLLLVPSSGDSLLWYPPFMKKIPGDPWSVSASFKDATGTTLAYLNAGPKTGTEQQGSWTSFRLEHLREEHNHSVHLDAHASALPFRGGTGSCVIDDYVTRVGAHHYREIACLVQGQRAESAIVAAALVSAWPKYAPQLERAIDAWQVR
jgi:hypothetical protein